MIRRSTQLLLAIALAVTVAPQALAQQEDDAVLKPAEPDFTLVGLPTALRLPRFKSAFRVTHRFARPLGAGDFGDLSGDLFGLDNGAIIGLEYRFGIVPNGQIGFHRSSSGKTIEFFGQYGVLRQDRQLPVDISVLVSVEGTNNLQDHHSPAIGAIVSRRFGERVAAYVEPAWVNNTNPLPTALADHNSTLMVGLGARVRVRPTVYLTGEVAPRAGGFRPGVSHGAFAIEKRAGGHVFQLNFSNSWATTMGQLARGGFNSSDWFMGFNISRKFF